MSNTNFFFLRTSSQFHHKLTPSTSIYNKQVPFFIVSTLYVYCDHENNPNYCNGLKYAILNPLAILGFANSLLNPIIYAWWHNGFRTNVTRIYAKRFERVKWCRWCLHKSPNEIATTLSPRMTNLSSTSNLSSGTTNTTTTGTIMADVNETVSVDSR